jgi:adenine phosphoribosyltransferase
MKSTLEKQNLIQQIKLLTPQQIKKKLLRIKKTFIGAPIINKRGKYPYSFFSLTDFNPPMDPDLVEDMADLLIYYGDLRNIDLIVSEADRGGGPLTHAVARKTGIPYTLANWYPIEVKGAISVKASVGFSGNGTICIFGLKPKQRIIFVDDIISSGGTARALIQAIHKAGGLIEQALFVGEKVNFNASQIIEKEFKIQIISLVKFIADGNITKSI